MPELDLDALVGRQESPSTLVRFEDTTDVNVPRLNYAVPLPGSFAGKLYIETDFLNDQLPWTDAAREDRRKSVIINDFVARLAMGETPVLPLLSRIATLPAASGARRAEPPPHYVDQGFSAVRGLLNQPDAPPSLPVPSGSTLSGPTSLASPRDVTSQPNSTGLGVRVGDLLVAFDQIASEARAGRAPVVYRTFGGTLKLDFVQEAGDAESANPRFVIIEHYRLSSFFGDYGAGKTVGVFSLMPGEETTLYIRNWRRSEKSISQASSIFDSFTEEAAEEFETDLQAEITDKESAGINREMHSKYSGSGEINIGFLKTKHSGEASDKLSTQTARETVTKNVAKVSTNHASKASSKRETEITQEIELTETQEFETITERKIKNTNLSRTLNIVTRELNQEFKTYFALVDVTLAFVNDFNVFEVYQIHEIDRMLSKYLPPPPTQLGEAVAPSPFGSISAYSFVRQRLIEQINTVYDFRGTRHSFLEEVSLNDGEETVFPVGESPPGVETYLRVRRPRRTDEPNPFYEPGFVPVEGVVMNESRHTVRTPAVIIDALLGHGVALDNYALGLQQEALAREQLENKKTELALRLIEEGEETQLEAFRSLFGSVDSQLLREVALPGSGGG